MNVAEEVIVRLPPRGLPAASIGCQRKKEAVRGFPAFLAETSCRPPDDI